MNDIKDFSLKEPFKSWYHGRIWEGPLVIAEAGNVLALHNIKEGKDLCSKYVFAPSGDRWLRYIRAASEVIRAAYGFYSI